MSQGRNTGWDTGWGMAEADGAKSRVTETGGHSGMGEGGGAQETTGGQLNIFVNGAAI